MVDPLTLPVGRLMRPAPTIEAADSLLLAARRLRESGAPILVVTRDDRYAGVLDDAALVRALANSAERTDAIEGHLTDRPTLIAADSAAHALRALAEAGRGEAVVLDPDGRPMGLLLSTALTGVTESRPTPSVVGGMATPLGVYLTSGAVSAGAPKWGLVLTGMAMFALVATGRFAEIGVRHFLPEHLPNAADLALGALPLALFVGLFRLLPLAGTHAAEHMAVNAIERGEPLVPEVVARMPRTHIRCGTNLAVGATLFFTILETPWTPESFAEVRLLVALLATLFFWKPLGFAAQLYVTTKPPSPKQIEDGVRAGRALLAAHESGGRVAPNSFQRIFNSGLLQVVSGSLLMFGILYVLGRLAGFDMDAF